MLPGFCATRSRRELHGLPSGRAVPFGRCPRPAALVRLTEASICQTAGICQKTGFGRILPAGTRLARVIVCTEQRPGVDPDLSKHKMTGNGEVRQ